MVLTPNAARDLTVKVILAHRLADEHAAIRPHLDRLMSYARRVYERAIPMLTLELQQRAIGILADWDMEAIAATDDTGHAWACHAAAQACVDMRILLNESGITDLRTELQLCHMVLESPWSVRLEIACARAHDAAIIDKQYPGIVDFVGDYVCMDTCSPGDVDAAALRSAMLLVREGCYASLEMRHAVGISNTQTGEQVDISEAFWRVGDQGIEAIVQDDRARDMPAPRRRRDKLDATAADLQAMIAGHVRQRDTNIAVAECVARLDALGTEDEVVVPETVEVLELVTEPEPVVTRGKVVALMGPSGAGKTSILEALLAGDPTLVRSVSWTTRSPRAGEHDGADYHFRSREQFNALVAEGGMLEHDTVYGRSYGIPRAPVEAAIAAGRTVALVIHVDGYPRLKAALPGDVVGVAVLASSNRVLEARLLARGDEQESVDARMRAARYEADAAEMLADHVVVNRQLEQVVEEARRIVGGVEGEELAMAA